MFGRADTLWAVPFDVDRLELTGEPVPVLEGVSSGGGAQRFGVAGDGSVVYISGQPGGTLRSLVWVDREGTAAPLIEELADYRYPRLSPDDTRVAVNIGGGAGDIWTCEIGRPACSRLTFEGGNLPIWTPDGTRITFSAPAGDEDLYWIAADGSGEAELLLERERRQFPTSWSPDGQVLAFSETSVLGRGLDTLFLPRDGEPEDLIVTSFDERSARFSPDGRWLAYYSTESGPRQVYGRPYPGPGGRQLVSIEGGDQPVWSRDGRELFFRNGDRLMVVDVEAGSTFSVGTPHVLFEGFNTVTTWSG